MVRCLESEGVERIFAIPGEETLEIVEALRRSPIEIVIVRHEQGAAFMADVHGRLTGRAGVCLGTLGPGATNLITGVADAYLDYAPMVAITGQVRLDLVHKESHQYVDVVDMLRPVTKWNARIERPETVPEVVRKAFKLAEAERPGPAHLELSETIAAAELPSSAHPLAKSLPEPPHPDDGAVREAAEIVRGARRPVILTGNGTIRAGAAGELRALCEHAGIPACPTFMGKGALDDRSLLSLPAVGVQARDSITAGLDEADVVVCVGYDLVEFGPAAWNGEGRKRIVHVDARPAEVDAEYIPEVELVGDVGETLRLLREELPPGPVPSYATRLRVALTTELRATVERPGFVSPQSAILAIRAAMGPSDILISDVGAHKLWLGRLFPAYEPNTVVISNGFATMGIGLPGAIAAALAQPERRAVTVSGDGGFMMNVQEMETATRLGLPVVVVVWVDGAYGVIGWKQERRFGRTHAIEFGNPVWAGLAAPSAGATGTRATAAPCALRSRRPSPRAARPSSPCRSTTARTSASPALGSPRSAPSPRGGLPRRGVRRANWHDLLLPRRGAQRRPAIQPAERRAGQIGVVLPAIPPLSGGMARSVAAGLRPDRRRDQRAEPGAEVDLVVAAEGVDGQGVVRRLGVRHDDLRREPLHDGPAVARPDVDLVVARRRVDGHRVGHAVAGGAADRRGEVDVDLLHVGAGEVVHRGAVQARRARRGRPSPRRRCPW